VIRIERGPGVECEDPLINHNPLINIPRVFVIPLETDGPISDHGINPANLRGRRRCRARRRSEKSRSVPERRHNVATFIQLETQQNKVFHVNVDRIASIWPNSDSTDCKAAIYTTNGQMLMVLEAVQQIMEKIKQANASQ